MFDLTIKRFFIYFIVNNNNIIKIQFINLNKYLKLINKKKYRLYLNYIGK